MDGHRVAQVMEAGLITRTILPRDISDIAQMDKGTFGHTPRHDVAGAGDKKGTGGIVRMILPTPVIGVGRQHRRQPRTDWDQPCLVELALADGQQTGDEVDIGKVQVGQEAMFTVDTFPDREFKGRVSAIYPKAVIQENVVNYDVVVTITGDYKNLLRPEMTTNVTIFLEARPNVLTVPSRALQRQRGRNVIYVQTPDGPQTREVKVGRREGQWVEILDGVTEGQAVFLKPPAPAGQNEMDL